MNAVVTENYFGGTNTFVLIGWAKSKQNNALKQKSANFNLMSDKKQSDYQANGLNLIYSLFISECIMAYLKSSSSEVNRLAFTSLSYQPHVAQLQL